MFFHPINKNIGCLIMLIKKIKKTKKIKNTKIFFFIISMFLRSVSKIFTSVFTKIEVHAMYTQHKLEEIIKGTTIKNHMNSPKWGIILRKFSLNTTQTWNMLKFNKGLIVFLKL